MPNKDAKRVLENKLAHMESLLEDTKGYIATLKSMMPEEALSVLKADKGQGWDDNPIELIEVANHKLNRKIEKFKSSDWGNLVPASAHLEALAVLVQAADENSFKFNFRVTKREVVERGLVAPVTIVLTVDEKQAAALQSRGGYYGDTSAVIEEAKFTLKHIMENEIVPCTMDKSDGTIRWFDRQLNEWIKLGLVKVSVLEGNRVVDNRSSVEGVGGFNYDGGDVGVLEESFGRIERTDSVKPKIQPKNKKKA